MDGKDIRIIARRNRPIPHQPASRAARFALLALTIAGPAFSQSAVMDPQARVTTAAELQQAINSAASSRLFCARPYTIWVENSASIDMDSLIQSSSPDNYLLKIPNCVTLASGRSATVDGGLLFLKSSPETQRYMLALGSEARVIGLRLRGPSVSSSADQVANGAILIENIGAAIVQNNEISAWPEAAVTVTNATNDKATARQISVTGNFIHDNDMCGSGYGVVVGKSGFAYIAQNLFDYNRHAVADDGCVVGQGSCAGNTGYIAELNFVLSGGRMCPSSNSVLRFLGLGHYYNQHFDVHGLGEGCGSVSHCGGAAGQFFDIRYNAIRGDQTYDNFLFWHKTRPALWLRGTPSELSFFRDNAVAHHNQEDAVRTPNSDQVNLQISNIQYNVDTSNQLAVGDFDGDGCADVFQATGAVWVYAPCGRREWRYLNQSSIKLAGLAFGDFNGDDKTDVFTQESDQWLISYGGTGEWTPLPVGSNIPMSNYGFADFDGDGKTDIFQSNGKEWFYSSGGATAWQHLNYSELGIKDIRFGHFNLRDHRHRKKADIFAIVNGEWSVSIGGTSHWQRLNKNLWGDLKNLVFGDFNGDGITDIATDFDGPPTEPQCTPWQVLRTPPQPVTWSVSWSGNSPWQTLNVWTPVQCQTVPSLSQMLIGRFDGQSHTDVIGQMQGADSSIYFFMSIAGKTPMAKRSVYAVQ